MILGQIFRKCHIEETGATLGISTADSQAKNIQHVNIAADGRTMDAQDRDRLIDEH